MTAESTLQASDDPNGPTSGQQFPSEAAPERRRAGVQLRVYCLSCGRSETVERAPAKPGRCLNCGGTLLTELDPA